MQMLTRTHQAIRELVQASAFVELNRFFDTLEAQWRQAPPGEFPAYLAAIEGTCCSTRKTRATGP